MAVMTMSNVQLFSHGLFRISQYDKSVMNNQIFIILIYFGNVTNTHFHIKSGCFRFSFIRYQKKPQSYDFYLNFDFIICSSAD